MQAFVAAQHRSRTWNPCWLTGHVFVDFARVIQRIYIYILSCNSSTCEVSLCIVSWLSLNLVQRIRQLVVPELSSFLPSRFNISVMGILQIHSLSISLLLKLINTIVKRFRFVFLLHQFRSRLSKQVISISFKKRICNIRWVSVSENRFITP